MLSLLSAVGGVVDATEPLESLVLVGLFDVELYFYKDCLVGIMGLERFWSFQGRSSVAV